MQENQSTEVEVDAAEDGISEEAYNKYFESKGETAPDEAPDDIDQAASSDEPVKDEPVKTDDTTQESSEERAESENRVPLAAFLEEKKRRRELQQKMGKMEETFQNVMERVQRISDQKQPPEPETISYDEDPIGALTQKQKALQAALQQQQEVLSARQKNEEMTVAIQNLVNEYRMATQEYVEQKPDFAEAYKFLVDSKLKEYMAVGLTKQEASQRLQEEELQVAQYSFKDGTNPGERIYNIAVSRGYKVAQPEAKPTSEGVKKIETLEKGLEKNRSLSSAGGKVAPHSITLERLAEMDASDPDFDKYWGQLIG